MSTRRAILSLTAATPADKAESLRQRVAEHLGIDPADVLIVGNAVVTVVDVAAIAPATPSDAGEQGVPAEVEGDG